jgi:hypothetical protein
MRWGPLRLRHWVHYADVSAGPRVLGPRALTALLTTWLRTRGVRVAVGL